MDRLQLLHFLRSHRFAVQASVAGHFPQAAIIGYAINDAFEIVFDTLRTSRKAANLSQNPNIALVMGGLAPGDERVVQYEGIADEPSGTELEQLKAVYYLAFPDGVNRASWPDLTYIRVKPNWIRFTDYNRNPPEIVEYRTSDL